MTQRRLRWAARMATALLLGGCATVALAGCATGDRDETGAGAGEERATAEAGSALSFPAEPPDGPMPEIGPAPEDYTPTAAGAPATDIWLGTLVSGGGALSISDLEQATDRDAYDNQPSFLLDGSAILHTAALDRRQTEIMRLGVTSRTGSGAGPGASEQVTHTEEASEFSALQIPGQEAFSAIHEIRGKQYLWRYDLSGEAVGPVFATAEPVGYHAWANEHVVAMFILGSPPTLQVGDALSGEIRIVAERPGRSIHRIPGTEEISFVRKVSDEEWWIERLDPRRDNRGADHANPAGPRGLRVDAGGRDPDGRRLAPVLLVGGLALGGDRRLLGPRRPGHHPSRRESGRRPDRDRRQPAGRLRRSRWNVKSRVPDGHHQRRPGAQPAGPHRLPRSAQDGRHRAGGDPTGRNDPAQPSVFPPRVRDPGSDIRTVPVNGRTVVRDGEITTLDEAEVMERRAGFADQVREVVARVNSLWQNPRGPVLPVGARPAIHPG